MNMLGIQTNSNNRNTTGTRSNSNNTDMGYQKPNHTSSSPIKNNPNRPQRRR